MKLKQLYYVYSNPASLSTVSKLYKASHGKLSKGKIKQWLQSQDAYTLHAPARKKFPRKQYYASGPFETVQMDLADMQNVAKYNRGFRFILCAIDIFSRLAFCIPVKNKTGPVMAKAIEKILNMYEIIPINCQTDFGKEFYNTHVRNVFKKYNVNHYSVYSEMKAAICERFIRTLKEKIYKYFTASGSYKYIHVLQDLVQSYNNTKHSTIKIAPAHVNDDNVNKVWYTLYGSPSKTENTCKLKPGDYVRISTNKMKFEKMLLTEMDS